LDTAQGAFGVPTTTPTQFDPGQLVASIERLMATDPKAAYPMHYSRGTGLPAIAPSPPLYAEMRALWIGLAGRHGLADPQASVDEYLSKDIDLNTQGLIAWL